MKEYIELEKEELPTSFEIDFGSETFVMALNYNEKNAFWTVDFAQADGTELVNGERLRLNQQLFSDLTDDRLPMAPLVPFSTDANVTEITKENFYETVFVFVDDTNDADDPLQDGEVG